MVGEGFVFVDYFGVIVRGEFVCCFGVDIDDVV